MEYITILLILLILILLKIIFSIKIKNIKKLKEIGYNENLNNIMNKFPENKQICEEILKKIKNEDGKIKEDENTKTSLYIVATNTIIIANIKNTFTRVQTVIHECIHSIQNKRILKFNFVYSNIYMLYYILSLILLIAGIYKNLFFHLFIILILSFIYYIIRSYLETDAMIRAEYVTKQYIEEKELLTDEEKKKIINAYEEINKNGVVLVNYNLILNILVKIIIFTVLTIVV